MAGADGGEGLRIDTSGLDETYLGEGRQPLLSPGGAPALRGLVATALVLVALYAVLGEGQLHLLVVPAAGLCGELLMRWLERSTRITTTHLDVQPGGRRRVVAWGDVRGVEPPGPLDVSGCAHLSDGTRLTLPNVPAEHVERLGAAIDEARRRHERGAAEGAT